MQNVTIVGTGVTDAGIGKERIGAAGNGDRWIQVDTTANSAHSRAF